MIGYPLDSHVVYDASGVPTYDRGISSGPLRQLINKLFSDGVLPNPSTNMQVTADGTGLSVTVGVGFGICNGCLKLSTLAETLTLDAADTSSPRYDTIVLRLDDSDSVRSCEFAIVKGTPATSPVAPDLTRSSSVWELGLADIYVRANAAVVTNANVTDTRYDTDRCGIISSISEFDTTTLYNQIQADLKEFKEVNEADFAEWVAEKKAEWEAWILASENNFTEWTDKEKTTWTNWITTNESDFTAWFEKIKGQLDTDAAGHLQNEIDALELKQIYDRFGLSNKTTVFNEDGSITETATDGTFSRNTVFGSDGNITETVVSDTLKFSKTTTFNSDGSITEAYERIYD